MHFTISNLDKGRVFKTFPQRIMVQGSSNNYIGCNDTLYMDKLWGFQQGSITGQTK
jgi:hypothetical protein